MMVRWYEPQDRPACAAMAKAQDMPFLDPDDEANIIHMVLEDDDGVVLASMMGRVTLEAVLLMNPDRSRQVRVHGKGGMQLLWGFFVQEVRRRRLTEIYAPIATKLTRFANYLVKRFRFHRDERQQLIYVLRARKNG